MEKKRDRTAALLKESPKGKSVLWGKHLAYYSTKLDLNKDQKDFVKSASDMLTEDFFKFLDSKGKISETDFANSTEGKLFKDLMSQIPKLFTANQAKKLFTTVGEMSTITDYGCGTETKQDIYQKISDKKTADSAMGNCTCTGSFCFQCPLGYQCGVGLPGTNCTDTSSGCGCFSHFACTGLCERKDGDNE